jgi:adenylate cyclase class IV
MRFTEIETKYSAKKIALAQFQKVCRSWGGVIGTSRPESYDHYFHNKGPAQVRHRECGRDPQLTVKAKMKKGNNFRRREANVHLAPGVDNRGVIEEMASILNLNRKFSIFKESHIIWFEKFNTVYYIVYSDSSKKKELGRFIEIEMSEDYAWSSEEEAWQLLIKIEKRMAPLGIKAKKRIKKSLYEMYRT